MLKLTEYEIYPAKKLKCLQVVAFKTLISRINTTYERFKARNVFTFNTLVFVSRLNFLLKLSMKIVL